MKSAKQDTLTKKDDVVRKLLEVPKDIVSRINRAKGLKQVKTGEQIYDVQFYLQLVIEGLKKFEKEYN